jgi:lipopolysaccharide heptosyltransferase II
MERILVFTTKGLGDALFLSPLIVSLKDSFLQSHLAVLCVPRVEEIFRNNPDVDKIIIFDERGKQKNLVSRLGLVFKLRKERFDIAFIVKPSLSRALLLKYAGIKELIGFNNPKSGWLLTVRIPPPRKALHKIDYFLSMAEYLGLKINQRKYIFYPSWQDKIYIEKLFTEERVPLNLPLIIINPGANWYPKRWPLENFTELIKKVKEQFPVNILITGAYKDKDLSQSIIRESGREVFDFTGRTTLGQLGALMQEADIVISADSGPMHIAAAVGKKVIALFGPTSALITGPYPLGEHIIIQKKVSCSVPCYDKECRDYRCMKAITVDEVLEKVEGLLAL